MLKLIWTPSAAGAPDDPHYPDAIDTLGIDGGTTVQDFRKGDTGAPDPDQALAAALDGWLAGRADPAAPIPVMVHGYQFDPSNHLGGGADDPYHLVYGVPGTLYGGAQRPLDYHQSWLPLVGECDDQGQNRKNAAIAFAWVSEASLADYARACWDNDYKYAALDLAPLAARALAAVLAHLAKRNITVRILAHSLGTRTVCQAVGLLMAAKKPAAIDRIVLLGGAEFCVDAAANYAACGFDVINLASRVDKVLSLGAEQGCHPVRQNGSLAAMVIGREGLGANPRWLDLQLDHVPLVDWCRRGFAPTGAPYQINAEAESTSHPMAGLNHWAYYMNDGNRKLVRDLLLAPAMTIANLNSNHVPGGVDSPAYGDFGEALIPQTPGACDARRPQAATDAGGPGGSG